MSKGSREKPVFHFVGTADGVNFHETNVRTYVHQQGKSPGVWFFSLEAASRVAVTIARTFWHLPYHHARITLTKGPEGIRYTSERRSPPPLPGIRRIRSSQPRSARGRNRCWPRPGSSVRRASRSLTMRRESMSRSSRSKRSRSGVCRRVPVRGERPLVPRQRPHACDPAREVRKRAIERVELELRITSGKRSVARRTTRTCGSARASTAPR